ncbi:hypothetical protein SDC9_166154 [bioreactor metagenome]|uniref:Tetratricopeptide repeat protein n=1 Tax=bioreactor metagenome TaxID=1076179 RepID=A0A645FW77_9ZZZZ
MKFLGRSSKRVRFIVLGAVILMTGATAAFFAYNLVTHHREMAVFQSAADAETAGDEFKTSGDTAGAEADFTKAEKLYLQCLRRDINNEAAVTGLARVLAKQGRWREASHMWSRAMTLNPFKQEYRDEFVNSLLHCANYSALISYLESLPQGEQNEPQNIELKIFAEACSGQLLKTQELMVPLSSVRQPMWGLGWAAAEMLLDGTPHAPFTPDLMVRASSDYLRP